MSRNGSDIRKGIEQNWHEYLSKYANLFSSNEIQGSSPPSVFVGSYGYPKVGIGPMLPPIHGDTTLLDAPERWLGKSLEEIVNYRLNLVRGIQKAGIEETTGRFIESLHELAMSSGSIDSEIELSVISIKKGSIPSFFRTVSLFFLVVDPFTL